MTVQNDTAHLNVVVLPFLAMGHIIPFANLSNILAQRGHRLTFISTPKNLRRLPASQSSSNINFLALPFPSVPGLKDYAECTIDVPPREQYLIKRAFDLLEKPVETYLEEARPDWIIYDFAAYWLPPIASRLGISFGFLSLFNAAMLGFVGPPEALLESSGCGDASDAVAESFSRVPKWIPFETNVRLRAHEARTLLENTMSLSSTNDYGVNDFVRFGMMLSRSDVVFIRSSPEFEPEWFHLLTYLYKKPVIPVGFIPPGLALAQNYQHDQNWGAINDWLNARKPNSVVYVAMGTEATLSRNELKELALGLERSNLPFFWVLRKKPWATGDPADMLPSDFAERVKERGIVWTSWAPQVGILGHDSVGGFLTHCGWNSVIEGLSFGRVLILLPFLNDQGVNARLLEEKKVGVEIPRDEFNGLFTGDSIAESLRIAMVEENGKLIQENARKMKQVFRSLRKNSQYIDEFVEYLVQKVEA